MDGAGTGPWVRVFVDRDWDPMGQPAFELLRARLAVELDAEADHVGLHRRCETCGSSEHGRPRVADERIDVGIAHSGRVLAFAIGHDARVGIDVEVVGDRTPERLERLASRVFSERELAEWQARPGDEHRRQAFLRAWTTKEAYLKALGVGLARSLPQTDPVADGWCVHALESVAPGAVVTVVTDRPAAIDVVDLTAPVPPSQDPCRRAHP